MHYNWIGYTGFTFWTILHTAFTKCQPSLAARARTYLLQTGSYDVSIHPWHLSVLHTVVFHDMIDIQTTAAVFCLSSSGSSARSSLYIVGRQAFPVSGVTVWNDLPLHVASAPSLAVFRQRLCFPVPTETLSYASCVTITIHHYCLDTRGPCNKPG